MALSKKENPKLFDIVKKELTRFYMKNDFSKYLSILTNDNELSDEDLNKITSLDLLQAELNSLSGLGKLQNLEKLSIDGISEEDYVFNAGFALLKSEKEDVDLQDYSLLLENSLNNNQLTNLDEIYKLKNLKSLSLNNQRKIKEIDLKYFPKLTNLSCKFCTSLEKISNISCLEGFKYFIDTKLDFSGCDRLNDIDDIKTLAEVYNYDNKKILLPTTAYMFLQNRYNIFQDDSVFNRLFGWTENSIFTAKIENTTSQMKYVKEYIDELINKYCDEDDSQMEKIIKLYTWISQNVEYDFTNLEYEKKDGIFKTEEELNDQQNISNRMRSSFVALFSKTAICVGISNLFNVMIADLGVLSNCVSCEAGKDLDRTNPIVRCNHQISAFNVNGGKYYFDPTADLGKETNNLKRFGMNKDEVSKVYRLSVYENEVENHESIYIELRKYMNMDGITKLFRAIEGKKFLDELEAENIF